MAQCLYDAVIRPLDSLQSCPKAIRRLVMCAIDHAGFSAKFLQRRGGSPDTMPPVDAVTGPVFRNILTQSTAKKHIHGLQSPADSSTGRRSVVKYSISASSAASRSGSSPREAVFFWP